MCRGDLVRFVGDGNTAWSRHAGAAAGDAGVVLGIETREFIDESGGVHYQDRVHVLWSSGQIRTLSMPLLEVVQQAEAISEAR